MVIGLIGLDTGDTMSTTDDVSESEEEYGTTTLNDRGRLTIPKPLRDDLNLDNGTTFTVLKEGGDIRLVRQLPDLETLTRGESWGEKTFRDAGEATFGEPSAR
jgi:AbrB family looped-hinge helix DNA binding protein